MYHYRYLIAFTLFVFVLVVGIAQVLFISLPFNPIKAKVPTERLISSTVPQGWAFFTRNAREAQVKLYSISEGDVTPIHQQHSSFVNYFGLKRASSKLLLELQAIRTQITDDQFENTEWNYQKNRYGNIPDTVYHVDNLLNDPMVCGTYLMVLQEHVPWAWSGSLKKIMMPAKVIRFHVSCP